MNDPHRRRAGRGSPARAGRLRCFRLAGILAIALCGSSSPAQQIHYERPVEAAPTEEDIGEGYVTPVVQTHPPRPQWREAADVAVLAVALGLGTALTLFWRNRRALVVLTIGCLLYFGLYREGCICPIGAIQNITVALLDPHYAVSLFVLAFFFLPLIVAVLFGRVFCGGVCPLGAIQELVVVKPVKVPRRLDWTLGWLKWVYLVLAIVFAALPAERRDFIICRYDPFVGFFRFTGPLEIMLLGAGLLILGLFVGRPYCRYLCPYGALLSLPSRLAWRGVRITPDKELDCGLCAEACPYGAIEDLRAVPATCLSCARCFDYCPRQRVRGSGGGAPESKP